MSSHNWHFCILYNTFSINKRKDSPEDWGFGGTTASLFGEDGRECVTSEIRWNSFLTTVNQHRYNHQRGLLWNRTYHKQQCQCNRNMSKSYLLFLSHYVNQTSFDIYTEAPNQSAFTSQIFTLFSISLLIFSPLLIFHLFCFHLQLSQPLLRFISMSQGALGQREAEHTRKMCAHHLPAHCDITHFADETFQNSVAE